MRRLALALVLLTVALLVGHDVSARPGGLVRPFSRASAPLTISNLAVWLKPDVGITLSGSNVTAWADQSGSGTSFTGAGTSYTYTASGGAGGMPYVTVSGTGTDVLKNASIGLGQTFTLFAVARLTSTASVNRHLFDGAANNTVDLLGQNATAQVYENGFTVTSGTLTVNTDYLILGVWNTIVTGGSKIAINGTSGTTATLSAATTTTGMSVGNYYGTGSFQWPGRVYEIVGYTRALSSSEQTTVCNYLCSRYALTCTC